MADYDFAGSFAAGIRARRDWEQTRALMEDRELRKQAAQFVEERVKPYHEARQRYVLAEARLSDVTGRIQAGVDVPQDESSMAMIEWGKASTALLGVAGQVPIDIVASGASNPHIVDVGRSIGEMAVNDVAMVMRRGEQLQGMFAEAEKLELAARETAVAERVGAANAAQSYAAAGESGARTAAIRQDTSQDAELFQFEKEQAAADVEKTRAGTQAIIGEERRAEDLHGSQRRFYEYGADLQGLKVDEARDKLNQDRELWRRDQRKYSREDLLQVGTLMREADALGIPEDEVDGIIRKQFPGKSISDFRSAHRGWSQETTAELEDLRADLDMAAQSGDMEAKAVFERRIRELEQTKLAEKRQALQWKNVLQDEGRASYLLKRLRATPVGEWSATIAEVLATGVPKAERPIQDRPLEERGTPVEEGVERGRTGPTGPPDPDRGGY